MYSSFRVWTHREIEPTFYAYCRTVQQKKKKHLVSYHHNKTSLRLGSCGCTFISPRFHGLARNHPLIFPRFLLIVFMFSSTSNDRPWILLHVKYTQNFLSHSDTQLTHLCTSHLAPSGNTDLFKILCSICKVVFKLDPPLSSLPRISSLCLLFANMI